eukprot:scaffold2718_cov103-Isochrysis_galbana.AAC.7
MTRARSPLGRGADAWAIAIALTPIACATSWHSGCSGFRQGAGGDGTGRGAVPGTGPSRVASGVAGARAAAGRSSGSTSHAVSLPLVSPANKKIDSRQLSPEAA